MTVLGDLVTHDDLSLLGLKYGTDKARDHWYTPHYHRRFAELREDPVTLLEIGIGGYGDPSGGGHSLRMWREYFPNAVIVGLDIMPHDPIDGCIVEVGDATDNRVHTARLLSAVTGIEYTPADLVRIGERSWYLRRLFNLRLGVGNQADTLPKRIVEQIRASQASLKDFNQVLAEFYKQRELDTQGVPSGRKLVEVGLAHLDTRTNDGDLTEEL